VLVERVCEICGTKFFRRRYEIRPRSPARFCSRKCLGSYIGQHYGFPVHRKIGKKRKWDYDEIWKLEDKTGWGPTKISKTLGIPIPTVSMILKKRR